jgi:hypothetical protein
MKFSVAAVLLLAPVAVAFVPQQAAFRPSSQLFSTEAATKKKVQLSGWLPLACSSRRLH